MSSFDDLETSAQSSRPLEIYQILLGGESFFYTSASADITVSGQLYSKSSIARTKITIGEAQTRKNVSITLPSDDPFTSQYKNVIPGRKATINIWRLQADESPSFFTQELLFSGRAISVTFTSDGKSSNAVCRSLEGVMEQPMPRFTYMGLCNNVLYDDFCQVAGPGAGSIKKTRSCQGP